MRIYLLLHKKIFSTSSIDDTFEWVLLSVYIIYNVFWINLFLTYTVMFYSKLYLPFQSPYCLKNLCDFFFKKKQLSLSLDSTDIRPPDSQWYNSFKKINKLPIDLFSNNQIPKCLISKYDYACISIVYLYY